MKRNQPPGPWLALAVLFPLFAAGPAGAQATLTVTTAADAGPGSLRVAIETANADGVPTEILFAPGLAGQTIALASALPALAEPDTTIDADLGGDCVPDVAIDGQGLPGANGLVVIGDGAEIRGLAIHSFDCPGCGGDLIVLSGTDGSTVRCNYLGTDLSATTPLGTSTFAIKLVVGADGNLIRDNLIAFNGTGVLTERGSGNTIGPGNVFTEQSVDAVAVMEVGGPGYPDFASLAADAVGVFTTLDFESDGGCGPLRNGGVVAPVDGDGAPFVEHFGSRFSGTVGVGAAGSYIFDLQHDDAVRLRVDGVTVFEAGCCGPSSVAVPLASGAHSIEVDHAQGPGYARLALGISGPGAATLSTDGNLGGCAGGQSGLCGELFHLRVPSEGNTITGNSMSDNGGLGIRLGSCNVAPPDDPGDVDKGPNTRLNAPLIQSLTPAGPGTYTVAGSAPPEATVEVFLADPDPSGSGEGQTLLASTTAGPGGAFSTAVPLGAGFGALTATATDPAGNTSQFGPNFAFGVPDELRLGAPAPTFPGEAVSFPVRVRDRSLTPLGLDRPAGQRIQALAFKVAFSPTSAVASASASRSGILAGLTPLLDDDVAAPGSIAYVASFDEATQPIPFTLDAPPPGDEVATVTVILAPGAPAGVVALTLDPAVSELSNQAGTLAENQAGGSLLLQGTGLTVLSNAARGLYAAAQSGSQVLLTWSDPNANQTGFRVERSPDGASWTGVGSAGPNDASFLDGGLAPATLYHYRLVTLLPAADSHASNVATALTFPASAAKVCVTRLSAERAWARFASPAWNGSQWGVAWQAREAGALDEILFQRFASTTLAPIGSPVNVSASETMSQFPVLAWNGARFGVAWFEHQRTEPGDLITSTAYFALLGADGSALRRGVRIDAGPQVALLGSHFHPVLEWDGTHWGLFTAETTTPPFTEVVYRRLSESGDKVLGPVAVTSTAGHFEFEIDAAFGPGVSAYGVAWIRALDVSFEVYFQRVEESTGAALGSPALLGAFAHPDGTFGLSVAWDPLIAPAGGWAVAWSEISASPFPDVPVFLRRVDAAGTPLGAGPERLSNDADPGDPAYDVLPLVETRSSGEFVVFTSSYSYLGSGGYEIARLHADASGSRTGSRSFMSPDDGRHSMWQQVAPDGDRFLVVWNDSGPGSLEVAGTVVGVSGTPGPVVPLTSGHSPGNSILFQGPGNAQVAPLAAGFVTLWSDNVTGPSLVYARTFDGAGATIANLSPLSSTPAGAPALAAVGDTFAVAWRAPNGDLHFARYDAGGGPVVAPAVVAGGVPGALAMAWSGEAYGVVGAGGSLRFQRVAPDGTPLGPLQTVVASGVRGPTPRILWTGGGWAVLYRGFDFNLYYLLLGPDGTVEAGPTALVTAAPQGSNARAQFDLAWNGQVLGVAWSDFLGADPPGADLYFTVLGLDGAKAFPEQPVVSGPFNDGLPRLYWAGGTFHLVHSLGFSPGLREIEIQPNGTVVPGERYWTHREGGAALAWNGVTLGLAWSQLRELYFETSACVLDGTPPPCPGLAASSLADQVHLAWPAVADPESGIWRYDLYRDGFLLAELSATTLAFDDPGYVLGNTHAYEVRAMNGAFRESAGCSPLSFSTVTGDANGDGALNVADVFYLINFLLGDGDPPAGDADANGDGAVTVADVFYLINFFFGGGPPPVWLGDVGEARR